MHVTVCICTRDRGARIATTLQSLLASVYHDFDLVVVDQSVADDTEYAVRAVLPQHIPYIYLRSAMRGSANAHNVALTYATGPLIAFTDDDCEVAPDWLLRIVEHFRAHPEVGQICGEVRAGPSDQRLGFIPTYHIENTRKITSRWLKWREHGIGANMGFRLSVLQTVGPFDEALGTGGVLHACLDGDMTYRVLFAGYAVLSAPDVVVVHHGFRTYAQGRQMMPRVGRGVAAAYMKQLRLGDLAILPTLIAEWLRCIAWSNLLRLRPPFGLRRFLAYGVGLLISFHYPIDHATRLYRAPSTTVPATDIHQCVRDLAPVALISKARPSHSDVE